MNPDLYVRNATVVTEAGRFHGGVVASGGHISQLVIGTPDIPAERTVEAGGRIVLPGIIDAHTHFSEPGRDFEGYRTGSMAAAAGGVTTILDMPLNDLPPTTSRERLDRKREMIGGESIIDYGLWGGLIDNNLDDLEGLHAGGVIAFKAFMRTVADFPRVDDGLLYDGLLRIAKLDNVVGVHAENEYVTAHLRDRLQSQGRIDRRAWNESRPPEQEIEAIQRAIFWAETAGARLHVCHISVAEAVALVRAAAQRGARITGETCAHYLFFNMEDYLRVGPRLRAAPPLRSHAEAERLWQCVLQGQVDIISSDHSPFPPDRYEKGMENVWEGGGGVMGLQSMLPAVITEGVHKRGMSWELLARLMSSNPARVFGIYPRKGALMPGSDADLTIIDPEPEWTLREEDLLYRHRQSPYVGRKFKGIVSETIVRGQTVYRNGEILAKPGHGKVVQRR